MVVTLGLIGGLLILVGLVLPWLKDISMAGAPISGLDLAWHGMPEGFTILLLGIIGPVFMVFGSYVYRYLHFGTISAGMIIALIVIYDASELRYRIGSYDVGIFVCLAGAAILIASGVKGVKTGPDLESRGHVDSTPKDKKGALTIGMSGVVGGLLILAGIAMLWMRISWFDPDSQSTVIAWSSGIQLLSEGFPEIFILFSIGSIGLILAFLGAIVNRYIHIGTLLCGLIALPIAVIDVGRILTHPANQAGFTINIEIGIIISIIGAVILTASGASGMRSLPKSTDHSSTMALPSQ